MTENERTYGEGSLFDGRYRLVRALSTAGGSANVWLAVDLNTIDETTDVSRASKVAVKIYRPRNAIDWKGSYSSATSSGKYSAATTRTS